MIRRLTSAPNPCCAGPLVHRDEVAVPFRAEAEPDAVVAGEVRRCLRRREHVIGREALIGVGKLALVDRAPELADHGQRRVKGRGDSRLDALGVG